MNLRKLLPWNTLEAPGELPPLPPPPPTARPRSPVAPIAFAEMQEMALAIAKSGMFGVRDESQALSLMLLCQAEGLHPALAVRRYHIIQGKPSMRADALQGEFEQAGAILWHERTETECAATFFRDKRRVVPERGMIRYRKLKANQSVSELAVVGEITIIRTIEDAIEKKVAMTWNKDAGKWVLKDNWKQSPRQMLHARCLSEGVRAISPGLIAGIYTEDEMFDLPAEGSEMTAQDRVTIATENRLENSAPVHWEDEIVHFGGEAMKGKRLGDLEPSILGWLQKVWKPQAGNYSDSHLRHVLDTMHSVGEEITEANFNDIVCHIGKAEGPILGKKIGEIPVKLLGWLQLRYGEGEQSPRWGNPPTEKDRRLKQAVDLALKKLE